MQITELSEPVKRILFLAVIVVGVFSVIIMGFNFLAGANASSQPTATPTRTSASSVKVSPLLFGTNLDISQKDQQSADQITSTQRQLQSMHVQIVRISLSEKPTQKEMTQQAQYIRQIGAVPLVSLHSSFYPQALTDDTLAIQTISRVFPDRTVYYEYGDEEDALGITVDQYTQSWNQLVPQLKQLAPKAQFVGPATYQYDQSYLQSFLLQAHPLPDAISWHEFTCNATWSQQQCMAGINNWKQHITSARALMSKITPTSLPVMITAWNYAANATPTDGKSTDKTFMTNWTQKALQTLATNGVFASMLYSGVNTPAPLVAQDNTPTPQGQTFRTFYEKSAKSATQSSPVPTATATPATTDTPTVTPTVTGTATPTTEPTATQGTTAIPTPTTAPGFPPVVPTMGPTPTTVAVPTPTPITIPSPTPTPYGGSPSPGVTPTPDSTPTVDATPPVVATDTPIDSSTPTAVATDTPIDSSTPTAVATDTPIDTPTVAATDTPAPAPTPTSAPAPTPTSAPAPTPTPKPTPTPTPKPTSTTHAVDGKNPTTYTVSGKSCASTLSNSTAKAVTFGTVKGTLYFQFSITCHAAWAKVVFSKPIASGALGNAKVVRTGDGKAYTCNTGGNQSVAPGQTSCYTGMVYDGPDATASAYAWYQSTSGSASWSPRLGPF